MKAFLLLLMVALSGIPSSAAETPSVTGKWKIHNSIVGNESDQDCSFAQTGHDLSGTCSLEQGSANVTGQVSDTKITWQYNTEYNGSPLTLVYTGTMDKDSRITGTVEVQPLSINGEFTAIPAK